MSYPFKICDPVHGFIRFGSAEAGVIDSAPFQRLRYIHQMGTAYLVYPGANHTRFEHSLGVMELVGRIYAILTAPHNQIFPLGKSVEELNYWLLVVRLAALCHDMGHLPFSHTAEKSLLPDGGHEQMTLAMIHSPELKAIWKTIGASVEEDVAKLAVDYPSKQLSPWERVLSQIITEDNFGADRIDYLIRDGHYTGVGYGHFDYHQLIDSLRILPDAGELSLGITASGMQSVESLWIARYMMYARVYHHPKARVYSNHMHRFMGRYFRGKISSDLHDYLRQTDYTLLTALAEAAVEGDYDANALLKRESAFTELSLPDSSKNLLAELQKAFGSDLFIEHIPSKPLHRSFPVQMEEGEVVSSLESSPFLREIPSGGKSLSIYVHPERASVIREWLNQHEYVG